MQIKEHSYVFPPRPADAIPRDQTQILGEMGWLAQMKYNDTRCLIKFLPSGEIQLWNRHAEKIRNYTPPDWLILQLQQLPEILQLGPGLHLLDGGLLDSKHKAIKDTIVIWDLLVHNGEHLLGSTYKDRYQLLERTSKKAKDTYFNFSHPNGQTYKFGISLTQNIFIPECHSTDKWPELWRIIDEINAIWTIGKPTDKNYQCHPLIEGLVFKNPLGQLEMGFKEKNNSSWLMRSRVKTGRSCF
jgi:hypothetical protein